MWPAPRCRCWFRSIAGACLVTLPTFEAGAALRMMADERCTLTSGNDTLFQMMMGHPSFDPAALHLRGGWAAAGPETIRNIIERMGARDLCVAYGLSEASPNVVLNDHRDPLDLRIAGLAKPHDGVEVRIADPATQASVPAGASGEIQVRGWNVMRGYYKNPEETAKVFTADGWLRTGDIGVLTEDGRLRMVGRTKDVFRVGGENVAPAEVEEVLLSHPAVATAQVVGVPDARLGEVGAAFVTLKGDAVASEAELADFVKRALRQLSGAALPGDRRELRHHRHDGERQGAEEQAARARDRAVRARRCRRLKREPPDERRHSVRVLRARRAAARGGFRRRPRPSGT